MGQMRPRHMDVLFMDVQRSFESRVAWYENWVVLMSQFEVLKSYIF